MPTAAAKTAKPKATATKATKAAPKKAAKSTKAAKSKKAAPVAPEAAVATFADTYRAWYSTRTEAGAPHVNPETWREARVKVCALAGCEEPGTGHRLAQCRIKTELTDLMTAVQRACLPGLYADRTGAAAAALTHRLTEITA